MAPAKDVAVGCRVRVYWEGDDAWFDGVVRKYSAENGYYVEYDDGEEQWEAENPDCIEFLTTMPNASSVDPRLILEAENDANNEYDEEDDAPRDGEATSAPKWSAEPPPSTKLTSPTAYDDDDYENDDVHDDAPPKHGASRASESPQSQEDIPVRRPVSKEPLKQPRDPVKYMKSGVFFRDPESLRDTKTTLQKEKMERRHQIDALEAQLQEKELMSGSLKRELHGLKAIVTVSTLAGARTHSKSKPKTARNWAERVAEQRAENRKARQDMSVLQGQLHEKQSSVWMLEGKLDQLKSRLDRVPKKDLSTLVEIQMEIAQRVNEKRVLEAELAKVKSKPTASALRERPIDPKSTEATEKSALEKQLRQVDKTLAHVSEEADEWRLAYAKENARIAPLQARIDSLQLELRKYESSQVLLRSVFLRMDRDGTGSISPDAAIQALTLLAHDATNSVDTHIKAAVAQVETKTLTFSQFAVCFSQAFRDSGK